MSLPSFNLEFANDKSLNVLLDIHDNSKASPIQFYPQLPENIGSKKRKRTFANGNYSKKIDGIAAKKAKRSQIAEEFFKEQKKFCNNYIENFLKDVEAKRVLEMKQRARDSAIRLYESVELQDIPLDVPAVAAERISVQSEKLKTEFEEVRNLAEKCMMDIGSNMIERNGAGLFNSQKLFIGDPMLTEKTVEKIPIKPDFTNLPDHACYRIMSYYDMFNPYLVELAKSQQLLADQFEAPGYNPTEEIFQALGTSRLGIDNFKFEKQHIVDTFYVPYLYSYLAENEAAEIPLPTSSSSSSNLLSDQIQGKSNEEKSSSLLEEEESLPMEDSENPSSPNVSLNEEPPIKLQRSSSLSLPSESTFLDISRKRKSNSRKSF